MRAGLAQSSGGGPDAPTWFIVTLRTQHEYRFIDYFRRITNPYLVASLRLGFPSWFISGVCTGTPIGDLLTTA